MTYTFDVYVSTCNQRNLLFYMVTVLWDENESEQSWTTSFLDEDISAYCSYIAEYLVGSTVSASDVSKVSGLFYMVSANVKRRILNEAGY